MGTSSRLSSIRPRNGRVSGQNRANIVRIRIGGAFCATTGSSSSAVIVLRPPECFAPPQGAGRSTRGGSSPPSGSGGASCGGASCGGASSGAARTGRRRACDRRGGKSVPHCRGGRPADRGSETAGKPLHVLSFRWCVAGATYTCRSAAAPHSFHRSDPFTEIAQLSGVIGVSNNAAIRRRKVVVLSGDPPPAGGHRASGDRRAGPEGDDVAARHPLPDHRGGGPFEHAERGGARLARR